jgi:hypothetical protein
MNERAAPPAGNEPEDPKGLYIVSTLLTTSHVAVVLMGATAVVNEHSVLVYAVRVIVLGKVIRIWVEASS